MNSAKNLILIKGENKTESIKSCFYNNQSQKYDVLFNNNDTVYSYSFNAIEWNREPKIINPSQVHIEKDGKAFSSIDRIFEFEMTHSKFWHIIYENGIERTYNCSTLSIDFSCLSNPNANNSFAYLNEIATKISLKTENGHNILKGHYERLKDFISEKSALACYLYSKDYKYKKDIQSDTLVFPFGCNASQFEAVRNAIENQISVIQGPPGTGKTQTILNIIANIVINNKTVEIVSNNNSAVDNIVEKLEKYSLDFIAAHLGSGKAKNKFIVNQSGEYPDISMWQMDAEEIHEVIEKIRGQYKQLEGIFLTKNQLANDTTELTKLNVEYQYFEQYIQESFLENVEYSFRRPPKSSDIMKLWQKYTFINERNKKISFLHKIMFGFIHGFSNWKLMNMDMDKIIDVFQRAFYQVRIQELTNSINTSEAFLNKMAAESVIKEFTDNSMRVFKAILYNKYGKRKQRKVFTEDDFWKNNSEVNNEYPVVLSTTYASKSGLGKQYLYDYVIMDEASQIDVVTGALALSAGKNAVIVGDLMQLPNVVPENEKKLADLIFNTYNLEKGYSFSDNSFLSSVCTIIPDVKQTMLVEHYRCHPKIIGFCNQKFYDNKLIVMTKDNSESDTLKVIKTVPGKHVRDMMNQREIDVIITEVLPEYKLTSNDIGVIAPYNNQVNAIKAIEKETDVATVHKFQGREKDDIIISTVDDEITEFTDNPNLLNVAISRAKNRLCLVTTGNKQDRQTNIEDLIKYAEYNNFEVTESEIYSVFDMMYQEYTQARLEYIKDKHISEYDSENIMYSMITSVLQENNYCGYDVVVHFPLRMIIRNPEKLDDEECQYLMRNGTHVDFLIYNKISKELILVIEVDGYHYHKEGTKQFERDAKKNRILQKYDIPLLRFATNGSKESEQLREKLDEIIKH